MTLTQRLSDDIKNALKAGDKRRVSALRMIKAAMKNREIEKGTSLTEDDLQEVFRMFVKRGKESIEQYSKAGREDLVRNEEADLAVIQPYLPRQLSDDEVEALIKDVIQETGAEEMKDMGRVMKAVMAKFKGRADGKVVNELVRKRLGEK